MNAEPSQLFPESDDRQISPQPVELSAADIAAINARSKSYADERAKTDATEAESRQASDDQNRGLTVNELKQEPLPKESAWPSAEDAERGLEVGIPEARNNLDNAQPINTGERPVADQLPTDIVDASRSAIEDARARLKGLN